MSELGHVSTDGGCHFYTPRHWKENLEFQAPKALTLPLGVFRTHIGRDGRPVVFVCPLLSLASETGSRWRSREGREDWNVEEYRERQ